jgi:hypothetical protein
MRPAFFCAVVTASTGISEGRFCGWQNRYTYVLIFHRPAGGPP